MTTVRYGAASLPRSSGSAVWITPPPALIATATGWASAKSAELARASATSAPMRRAASGRCRVAATLPDSRASRASRADCVRPPGIVRLGFPSRSRRRGAACARPPWRAVPSVCRMPWIKQCVHCFGVQHQSHQRTRSRRVLRPRRSSRIYLASARSSGVSSLPRSRLADREIRDGLLPLALGPLRLQSRVHFS